MTILRQVLTKIWHWQAMNGDEIVACCLLVTMLASSAHLVTMLATRWGDRHVAVKSFMASVMVHAVCLMSLEVFEPIRAETYREQPQEFVNDEVVTKILVESEDVIALRESGNTPIPDSPSAPDVELSRLPPARIMEPQDTPQRQAESLDSLKTEVDDVSQFEQSMNPETTMSVDSGTEGRRVVAANDPASEIDTMLEQSKADVYVPNTERRRSEKGDIREDDRAHERQMTAGSVNKIDTDIEVEDTSIATVISDLPESLTIPRDEDAVSIKRRSAPLNASDPLQVAGISLDNPRKRTMRSRSFDSRLPRPSRSIRNRDPGERAVRQNSLTPQTLTPLTSDYDEVRTGTMELNLTDALRSAATMVDADANSSRRRDSRPATYKLRSLEERREAARKFGGTRESEAAVELSLKWLSAMQSDDGHWDAETYGAGQIKIDRNNVPRNHAGRDADTGITALVTLSFLGAGYTHEQGKYALNVDDALHWLIEQQDEDGALAGDAGHYARMYCHAMATYALAEAVGMQEDIVTGPIIDPAVLSIGAATSQSVASVLMHQHSLVPFASVAITNAVATTSAEVTAYSLRKVDDVRLRTALLKAVTFTISQQDPKSGGWRYKFGQEGDVSMFGWQMMSLKSAAIAGYSINPVVRDRMTDFLNSVRQGDNGGLFGYRRSVIVKGQETERITPTMTAEALFCQQMLGYPRDSAASREAVQYLLRHMPRLSELNNYYWYYGTLAMYQYGGQPWEDWNQVVRDTLIGQQRQDGKYAGSWDPNGPWGPYGGRLYSTALSTLTLEVYYRLLPLYRLNEATSAAQ